MDCKLRAKLRDCLRKESVQEAYREGYIDGIADSCPICCKKQSNQQQPRVLTPEEKLNIFFQNIDWLTGRLYDKKDDKEYVVWIATWLSNLHFEVKEALREKGIRL